jgi:hypothetical protein
VFRSPRTRQNPGLISRDGTACLKSAQSVKIRREGERDNEGQQDQRETFEHFLLQRGPTL